MHDVNLLLIDGPLRTVVHVGFIVVSITIDGKSVRLMNHELEQLLPCTNLASLLLWIMIPGCSKIPLK